MPMALIRARWVAAWVFAQGNSGPPGKYWTSSCMYLPDGSVMPAYSTWQPTEGKIPPTASADQRATRRLVAPRGDLMRGNPIASTLLGDFGGPSNPFLEGGMTALGIPIPIPRNRLRRSFRAARPVTTLAASPLGRMVRSSGFLLGYGIGRIGRPSPMIPAVSTKCVLTAVSPDRDRTVVRAHQRRSSSA